ncbi:family 10 glycosylhydrolase [Aureibaculum sp. 2210JD6-5]|uniref:glycoside hydrolase family 10 protein n=1 Tax=Aureibaculum sp. 2210JD6-5 TaxID=3103957 RepID=UPI002AAC89B0|nr:family 10 glycosylhydrolase [Aureibaculum sp. 2210JD6-5]MDY7393765.1 family 10 glycosylhydrolase [Aureibaculum sp. 2210JD6-5]
MNKKIFYLTVVISFITNLLFAQNINHEFRGVWIATVNNIDWPSEKNLTPVTQKAELIRMLDKFKDLNFNAVIFQIRPTADAFYNSKYEPWSAYLTDSINSPPNPYFDPLAFAIAETHKRGMEFHAWLNPYRVLINYDKTTTTPLALIKEKPEWFLNYGNTTYFNPGVPEVRAYTNKVVADIVQNYDVDAIHFDDYFYPYKIEGEAFPDEESFKNYGGKFYPDQLENWRRDNVSTVIKELHTTIKSIKPWVQFGISPFGVWRNKADDPTGSDTDAGQTNYDDLYADVLLWLKNGWLDYILPQIYWHIGHDRADYKTIAEWWIKNNYNTNLYIGQAMYRLGDDEQDEAWTKQDKTEIEKQLDLNKTYKNIKGTTYFSAKSFNKNAYGINEILKEKYYQYPTLPPSSNHKKEFIPEPVSNIRLDKIKRKNYQLSWNTMPENTEKEAVKFLIYKFDRGESMDINNPSKIIALTGETHFNIHKKVKKRTAFVIFPVSRNNNIGKGEVFVR